MSERPAYTPQPAPPPPVSPAGHELASVGLRIAGGLIDVVLFWIVIFIGVFLFVGIAVLSGADDSPRSEAAFGFGTWLLVLGIFFAYYILTEAVWGGTPAKLMLGMRVVRAEDGLPISWGRSFGRNLLRIVDGLFFYLVGLLTLALSQKRQRVGDLAASTLVVKL
jgi:uncharacterized RDD family membrane protein YckC